MADEKKPVTPETPTPAPAPEKPTPAPSPAPAPTAPANGGVIDPAVHAKLQSDHEALQRENTNMKMLGDIQALKPKTATSMLIPELLKSFDGANAEAFQKKYPVLFGSGAGAGGAEKPENDGTAKTKSTGTTVIG